MEKHTRLNSSSGGGSSSNGSSNSSCAEGADAGSHALELAALWAGARHCAGLLIFLGPNLNLL